MHVFFWGGQKDERYSMISMLYQLQGGKRLVAKRDWNNASFCVCSLSCQNIDKYTSSMDTMGCEIFPIHILVSCNEKNE